MQAHDSDLLEPLLLECSEKLYIDIYGMKTLVHCQPRDRHHIEFNFRDALVAQPTSHHVEVWLWASGGFYQSLTAQDGSPKLAIMREPAAKSRVSAFRFWPNDAAYLPPFASKVFIEGNYLIPGEVVVGPENQAMLITGEVHIGKTRMTMQLFERGWTHHADHLAVFENSNGHVWQGAGIAGLRRQTLHDYANRLLNIETRTTHSAVTGKVELARIRDLFPHMTPTRKQMPLTHWVHLVRGSSADSDAPPATATLEIFPSSSRHHAERNLKDLPRTTINIDSNDSLEKAVDRIALWIQDPH